MPSSKGSSWGSNLSLLYLLHWQAGSLPLVYLGKPIGLINLKISLLSQKKFLIPKKVDFQHDNLEPHGKDLKAWLVIIDLIHKNYLSSFSQIHLFKSDSNTMKKKFACVECIYLSSVCKMQDPPGYVWVCLASKLSTCCLGDHLPYSTVVRELRIMSW